MRTRTVTILTLTLMVGCATKQSVPPEPQALTAAKRESSLPPTPKALAIPMSVQASTVTLAWSPVFTATDYRLFRGTASGHYTNVLNVVATNATVPLILGFTNYFVVTSRNAAGESGFSNEAFYNATTNAQKKTLAATVISYVETSTNNQFSAWTAIAVYTNYFPVLPDPSFFQTRLSITVTNSP